MAIALAHFIGSSLFFSTSVFLLKTPILRLSSSSRVDLFASAFVSAATIIRFLPYQQSCVRCPSGGMCTPENPHGNIGAALPFWFVIPRMLRVDGLAFFFPTPHTFSVSLSIVVLLDIFGCWFPVP